MKTDQMINAIFANMNTCWIKLSIYLTLLRLNFNPVYVLAIWKTTTLCVAAFEALIPSICTYLRIVLWHTWTCINFSTWMKASIHFFKATMHSPLHQFFFCPIHLIITPPSISNLKCGQFNSIHLINTEEMHSSDEFVESQEEPQTVIKRLRWSKGVIHTLVDRASLNCFDIWLAEDST